jgi:hypothetical protein
MCLDKKGYFDQKLTGYELGSSIKNWLLRYDFVRPIYWQVER